MEFSFQTTKILQCDDEGFATIDGGNPQKYKRSGGMSFNAHRSSSTWGQTSVNSSPEEQLDDIINKLGAASAKAQKLPSVITTSDKLFTSDNRLYVRAHGKQVIGMIKVGKRNLFIRNDTGAIKEIKPLCVLDFYVHESVQRGGHGKALFDKMLESENAQPSKLGYDRPSEKLIGFCGKHFGLKKYTPQNNNFVVFDAYWGAQDSAYDRFKQTQIGSQAASMNGSMQSSKRGGMPPQHPNYQQNHKNASSNDINSIFGGSQASGFQGRGRQGSIQNGNGTPKGADMGPRKLSNTGLQVINGETQSRYGQMKQQFQQAETIKGARKQVSFDVDAQKENQYAKTGQNLPPRGGYGPSSEQSESHFSKFQQQQQNDPRSQYEQSMKQKSSSVINKGANKGFSTDKASDLLMGGHQGPLDYAQNNSRKDANSIHMGKYNDRINGYSSQIAQKEAELEKLQQDMVHKQASATASNINRMYGDGSQRGMATGFYPQGSHGHQESAKAANTFYSGSNDQKNNFQGIDHKSAVNDLYNKRNTQYNQLYNQSEGAYKQRAENDKNISQYQKKINDGGSNSTWGQGFKQTNRTSNQQIGGHYSQQIYNRR